MKKILCLVLIGVCSLFVVQCGEDEWVDDGLRFISFTWSNGTADEYFAYMPSATYAGTNGAYTLVIEAKDSNGSQAPQIRFSTSRVVNSNWVNSSFEVEAKLSTSNGYTTLTASSKKLTIQDDGRESGVFRATFSELIVETPSTQATLRNGVIQADVVNNSN